MQSYSKKIPNVVYGIILLAALSRLVPHLPNFTPIGAMALFGGAFLASRGKAIGVVFAAMILSDFVIGFHNTAWAVYLSLAFIVLVGNRMGKGAGAGVISCFISSLIFFVVTNFAVWFSGTLYPASLEGLALCYLAAIPFFWATLAGDLFYFGLMCGLYRLTTSTKSTYARSLA